LLKKGLDIESVGEPDTLTQVVEQFVDGQGLLGGPGFVDEEGQAVLESRRWAV
jgi:hypothetical protein